MQRGKYQLLYMSENPEGIVLNEQSRDNGHNEHKKEEKQNKTHNKEKDEQHQRLEKPRG